MSREEEADVFEEAFERLSKSGNPKSKTVESKEAEDVFEKAFKCQFKPNASESKEAKDVFDGAVPPCRPLMRRMSYSHGSRYSSSTNQLANCGTKRCLFNQASRGAAVSVASIVWTGVGVVSECD